MKRVEGLGLRALVVLFCCVMLVGCGSRRKAVSSGNDRKAQKELLQKYEKLIGADIPQESYPLYRFIDSWIGVPYCYGGKTRKCTDCSGFTCNLYQEVYGRKLPRSAVDMMEESPKVKRKRLEEGNLLFFATEKRKKATHVGVYLGNGKFVHASTSKGVRIDNLEDAYFQKTFLRGGKP